ncbi:PREDICTED: putative nuclease HARBI1 [Erythranthe guttata]|uniref:putative nuclease HARBI1 n=1 Tax=Erythranthe guttata TaxID=4155 RepID=UPI00064DB76C|nr:PREDICTED: putative nuclease HARBI1 [Erythranthe guttata]|eukprot:XP_012833668.1 PREDICTED: putative nuclease HARBI1 [Erythranthe guttata]
MAQQGSDNSSSDDDNQGNTMMTTMFVEYQSLMLTSQGKQKPDASGNQGFSPHVKMTVALRILVYRYPADAIDEYLKIAASTSSDTLKNFCRAVNAVHGEEYLRRPNNADMVRLLKKAEQRGFPGMLGSVDCMHWEWKNCPTAWAGTYSGRHGKPTIILEAVASYDTWIWHSYFGPPGVCNDFNVLYSSPIFNDVVEGLATNIRFTINGRVYKQGYYLADGIYPCWSTIVQAIPDPQGRDKQLFTRLQEAYRKDVERTFDILQSRFEFITGPCRLWHNAQIGEVMKCCIILHNMIVEDNRNQEGDDFVEHVQQQPVDRDPITIAEYLSNRAGLTDTTHYFMLRNDLVEHVWKEYRDGNLNV